VLTWIVLRLVALPPLRWHAVAISLHRFAASALTFARPVARFVESMSLIIVNSALTLAVRAPKNAVKWLRRLVFE